MDQLENSEAMKRINQDIKIKRNNSTPKLSENSENEEEFKDESEDDPKKDLKKAFTFANDQNPKSHNPEIV